MKLHITNIRIPTEEDIEKCSDLKISSVLNTKSIWPTRMKTVIRGNVNQKGVDVFEARRQYVLPIVEVDNVSEIGAQEALDELEYQTGIKWEQLDADSFICSRGILLLKPFSRYNFDEKENCFYLLDESGNRSISTTSCEKVRDYENSCVPGLLAEWCQSHELPINAQGDRYFLDADINDDEHVFTYLPDFYASNYRKCYSLPVGHTDAGDSITARVSITIYPQSTTSECDVTLLAPNSKGFPSPKFFYNGDPVHTECYSPFHRNKWEPLAKQVYEKALNTLIKDIRPITSSDISDDLSNLEFTCIELPTKDIFETLYNIDFSSEDVIEPLEDLERLERSEDFFIKPDNATDRIAKDGRLEFSEYEVNGHSYGWYVPSRYPDINQSVLPVLCYDTSKTTIPAGHVISIGSWPFIALGDGRLLSTLMWRPYEKVDKRILHSDIDGIFDEIRDFIKTIAGKEIGRISNIEFLNAIPMTDYYKEKLQDTIYHLDNMRCRSDMSKESMKLAIDYFDEIGDKLKIDLYHTHTVDNVFDCLLITESDKNFGTMQCSSEGMKDLRAVVTYNASGTNLLPGDFCKINDASFFVLDDNVMISLEPAARVHVNPGETYEYSQIMESINEWFQKFTKQPLTVEKYIPGPQEIQIGDNDGFEH